MTIDLDHGCVCPTCGQFAKRYVRKLNSGMARALIYLYRLAPTGDWVHYVDIVKEFSKRFKTGGVLDYSKLRWWGLIESRPVDAVSTKKHSGFWRITTKGREFVENKTTVPARIVLYRNRFEATEGEEITITDVLDHYHFDYHELMTDSPEARV